MAAVMLAERRTDSRAALADPEASLVAFDDEGRRDLAEANRARHSAAGLLDQSDQPSASGVISAAARFQTAGFRWEPTRAELEAAIAVHGLLRP